MPHRHSSTTYVNFEIDIFTIEKDHCAHEPVLDWLRLRVLADRMALAIGLVQIGEKIAVGMILMVDLLA